ncbi:hypothetical protein ES708_10074 [subsurface metagenome]
MNNSPFTWREEEIIELLKYGYSYKEIAVKVHLSLRTVNEYARLILAKMRARSMLHAILKAIQEGYIKVELRKGME